MRRPVFLWRLEVRVTAAAREAVETLLETKCAAVSAFEDPEDSGEWRVEGFTDAEPDREKLEREIINTVAAAGGDKLSALRAELVPERDWVADNLLEFPPVRIGRFFIHGSHIKDAAPPGTVPIRLDPGTAFGSGEHASTAGCLAYLLELSKAFTFKRPLDMGCGSGILSIALAKTLRVPVVASDLDDEAARVTAVNARINNIGPLIRAVCGNGYRSHAVRAGGPYDLIFANILARPLIKMAGDLDRHLLPKSEGGGIAILSGLLERDGRRVLAAHEARGLTLQQWRARDGWLTMVLKR